MLSDNLKESMDGLLNEMKKSEADMKRLLQNSEDMMKEIDWANVRDRAKRSKDGMALLSTMIGHLVDAYLGVVSNCSALGTSCALSADFAVARGILESPPDATSLDWILKAANESSSNPISSVEEELNSLSDSFASMCDVAHSRLKHYLRLASGC